MNQMSANMIKPLYSALPEEERQAFAEWLSQKNETKAKPIPEKKSLLDKVADTIGEFYRPGREEEAISEIMMS